MSMQTYLIILFPHLKICPTSITHLSPDTISSSHLKYCLNYFLFLISTSFYYFFLPYADITLYNNHPHGTIQWLYLFIHFIQYFRSIQNNRLFSSFMKCYFPLVSRGTPALIFYISYVLFL